MSKGFVAKKTRIQEMGLVFFKSSIKKPDRSEKKRERIVPQMLTEGRDIMVKKC